MSTPIFPLSSPFFGFLQKNVVQRAVAGINLLKIITHGKHHSTTWKSGYFPGFQSSIHFHYTTVRA